MAPTKKDVDKVEKEAKLTPEQSTALILDYLRKQNRPYSATDISANLKNRVTKTVATKLLKDLHERKDIEGRTAGKQIVYHAIQDEADESSPEDFQSMNTEIDRLKTETSALKVEEKQLRATLKDTTAQMPLAELKALVARLEAEKADILARLSPLRDGSVRPVTVEERKEVHAEYKKWTRVATSRKKIGREMWQMIVVDLGEEKAHDLKEALDLCL